MDKLENKLNQYADRFKDDFPTIPLMWGRSEEEVVSIINRCLREGKDVYTLGLVVADGSVLY